MKCPSCGTRLLKDAPVCPTCYTPVVPSTGARAAVVGPPPQPSRPPLLALRPRHRQKWGLRAALLLAALAVVAVVIVGIRTLEGRNTPPQAIPPISAFAYRDLVPSGMTFKSAVGLTGKTQSGRALAHYDYWALQNGVTYYFYQVIVWDSAAAAQARIADDYAFFMATPSMQVWRPLPTGEWVGLDQRGDVNATTSANTVSMSFETGGAGFGAASATNATNNVLSQRKTALTIMQRVRQAATTH